MMKPETLVRIVLSFGPFRLVVSERLLTKDGVPVELGGRTLDTLIALASRPNEVMGKRELMAEVWPDVIVEEGSLRFHITALRKALGDGQDGARYITTLAGRGYCFVAPVTQTIDREANGQATTGPFPGVTFLPSRLLRMVGRADDVATITRQLAATRFVTIVGPGGVGKTTVAVAVAHDLLEAFDRAVLFVDFGMLDDPSMVPASVASMLGIPIHSDDPTPGLIAYLHDKRLLLILDNCEHVIEAVANLVASIFPAAPQLHILATSREALRVEGEQVQRLMPLTFPPDAPGLTAAMAMTFPATELFVERAAATGVRLDLSDRDATIIAGICRKLDGVALAIELAAGRVEAYGLQQTAALLDERLTLLWQGQRTAPPRQKTLQATLDWSYGLLTEPERLVLCRLAVFVGQFTIEAALSVVTSPEINQATVFNAIDSLVAKSMIATRPAGATMRYRLLETTRAYALGISASDGEFDDLAARHAAYSRRWLEQTETELRTLSSAAERAPFLAGLGNVRAALDWAFGANGNAKTGVEVAAAGAPIFLALSLLTECQRWSERAIQALDDTTRGGREEMHLQAALGMSLMFTSGGNEKARVALNRSLAIAEDRGDALNQLQLFGLLQMYYLRIGDFKTALQYAKRGVAGLPGIENLAARALAHSLLGISLHHIGDLGGARLALEAALHSGRGSNRTSTIYLGFDGHNLASATLARTLWLQGFPEQAIEVARQTVKDAAHMDHPVTLSIALIWAVSVFLWTGDIESAGKYTDWLISHAHSHSLAPYLALGRGFEAKLAICRGDASEGVDSLQRCLEKLHAARYELHTTPFNMGLAEGLVAIGRSREAMTLIDETIASVEANGDLCYMPELWRVKGKLICSTPEPNLKDAENCFTRSLGLSRGQSARSWELRAAIDLAQLTFAQGQRKRARELLKPVFEQFVEGLQTADCRTAKRLILTLE